MGWILYLIFIIGSLNRFLVDYKRVPTFHRILVYVEMYGHIFLHWLDNGNIKAAIDTEIL